MAQDQYERFHDVHDDDHRNSGERDRDRVMFSRAVQRLAGVTQIISPVDGFLHHNRLTHTLEMAQLGRRLSQMLNDDGRSQSVLGRSIDPNVVEAACLVHDAGHPPFGHAGEVAIDSILAENDVFDGYEGNAQSFRIITLLEPYRPDFPGLNLCKITLQASLKYPWPRSRDTSSPNYCKWGVYDSENTIFQWCTEHSDPFQKTVEAHIMDTADDIIYSIHDIFDFSAFGMIPLRYIHKDPNFLSYLTNKPDYLRDRHGCALDSLSEVFSSTPYYYTNTRKDLCNSRLLSSNLIKRFRDALILKTDDDGFPDVTLEQERSDEVWILKRIANFYIHSNHIVVKQQAGFISSIKNCLQYLFDSIDKENFDPFPEPFRSIFMNPALYPDFYSDQQRSSQFRLAADYISSLTDDQLLSLMRMFSGMHTESKFRFI